MTDVLEADSYALWIRRTLARARAAGGGRIVPLFDSSVPEPADLLTATLARAFAPPVTDRYVSAFSGGNPHVVAHLRRRYGVASEQLLCTTGATAALSMLYRALLRPGQRIAVETPGFDLFGGIAALHGIAADTFQRPAPDFALDLDRLAAAIRPATRMVVVSNLHNPSSAAIPHDQLLALAQLAEDHDLLVVVDEVYGDYADAATRPCAAVSLSPRFVTISSLTKIYGLSTLRCGWIVGDADVVARVRALADRFEFGVSNLAHAAAALVMDDAAAFTARTHQVLDTARPIAEAAFARWQADGWIEGALPRFGCVAFPRLVGIEDTAAFAEWLGDRCGVVVAPGEYFGAPGHVRIGFAQPPALLAVGLDAMEDGLRHWHSDPHRRIARG
ncbi:pyridoxal phosphate-dependent aminotransferase [Sphingomonas adhaesiva]|uniref:pyridoxal phosphate-dependent aminotransferase n=1 Tax=Sphingomonas adhaesiva TaxID=28212 RepID=UPI002FF6E0AE